MSKGNNRKGNRELKKPKKQGQKGLATQDFSTKSSDLKISNKKTK